MDRRNFLKGLTALVATISLPKISIEERYSFKLFRPTGFVIPVDKISIRNNIYNAQIKELLLTELKSMKFTPILGESDGQPQHSDYQSPGGKETSIY